MAVIETLTTPKLRYMRSKDIPEVMVIDRAAFNPSWPLSSYRFELDESRISYMVVLEMDEQQPVNGIRRLWHNLRGQNGATIAQKIVVAYGGLWKIADEAHISTIASHPQHRGMKYGEIVLVGMLRRAIQLGASYIVLEVRVSNTIAQALYHKYGFSIFDTKPGYYHNDKEDAYDMRLQLTNEVVNHFYEQYQALQARNPFLDDYSCISHPRTGN